MIKQNVNFSLFCDSFSDTYKNNFTYEGKRALFDYLENLSEDIGEDIELDIVALCCEYSEFADFADYSTQYTNATTIDEIENYTTYIPIEGTTRFIIQSY